MLMKLAFLHTDTGQDIPLQVDTLEGKTFLECREPAGFLHYITGGGCVPSFSSDTYLRGVVIPGEGAFFQLCDQFGVVADDIAQLNDEDVEKLLKDIV